MAALPWQAGNACCRDNTPRPLARRERRGWFSCTRRFMKSVGWSGTDRGSGECADECPRGRRSSASGPPRRAPRGT
eukprot:3036969-Pleurochrysis_carterae.AAC.1